MTAMRIVSSRNFLGHLHLVLEVEVQPAARIEQLPVLLHLGALEVVAPVGAEVAFPQQVDHRGLVHRLVGDGEQLEDDALRFLSVSFQALSKGLNVH